MHVNVSRMLSTALLLALIGPGPVRAVDTSDTSFLHEPAISEARIVFVYAEDLWTAKPDGSDVRWLTAHPGVESNPYVSPDGKSVAFTADYDGNPDVFIVPIEGGEPVRLTWHPGPDFVCGFAPDGAVLFRSPRSVFSGRFVQFFTVGPKGGFPKALPIPNGFRAAYSPDGKYLPAYSRCPRRSVSGRNYRGRLAGRGSGS